MIDQVRAAIAAYDAALRADDLDAVDAWFLDSEATTRIGVSGIAYGIAAVASGRRDPTTASPPPVDRVDGRHELIPLGGDVVVATLEHQRAGDPRPRRRTQVWWQVAPGAWRIAHAHMSIES